MTIVVYMYIKHVVSNLAHDLQYQQTNWQKAKRN